MTSQHIQGCGFNSSTTNKKFRSTRKLSKKSENGLAVSYLQSNIPDQCHTKPPVTMLRIARRKKMPPKQSVIKERENKKAISKRKQFTRVQH